MTDRESTAPNEPPLVPKKEVNEVKLERDRIVAETQTNLQELQTQVEQVQHADAPVAAQQVVAIEEDLHEAEEAMESLGYTDENGYSSLEPLEPASGGASLKTDSKSDDSLSFVDRFVEKISQGLDQWVERLDQWVSGESPVEESVETVALGASASADVDRAGKATSEKASVPAQEAAPPASSVGEKVLWSNARSLELAEMADSEAPIFTFPLGVNAKVSLNYGQDRVSHKHAGVDISVKEGTPLALSSSENFVVARISYQASGAGNYIVLRSPSGQEFKFFHLQSVPPVKVGETLRKGQIFGFTGDTGRSTAPHLHFEVWAKGSDGKLRHQNPTDWVSAKMPRK